MKDLNNLDVVTKKTLSRKEVSVYFGDVEKKIKDYTGRLEDEELLLRPEECKYTRFTLILAQHRHLHTHMGMIMGFITAETGMWPRVCLKIHSDNLHAPLCGIFPPNSVNVARYASLIRVKDAQLAESNF